MLHPIHFHSSENSVEIVFMKLGDVRIRLNCFKRLRLLSSVVPSYTTAVQAFAFYTTCKYIEIKLITK